MFHMHSHGNPPKSDRTGRSNEGGRCEVDSETGLDGSPPGIPSVHQPTNAVGQAIYGLTSTRNDQVWVFLDPTKMFLPFRKATAVLMTTPEIHASSLDQGQVG